MLSWLRRELTQVFNPALGANYSPPSLHHSPDTTSPLYPARPIRPLPKRRIRSRLSPDLADAISYPPAPSTNTPLFYFPHSYTESRANSIPAAQSSHLDHDAACEHAHSPSRADDLDSEEEEAAANALYHDRLVVKGHQTAQENASYRQQRATQSGVQGQPQPPASATSSVDGYDSFENTNNKKKRKIPTPGSSGNHHSHLSGDMANMGLSSSRDGDPPSPDELGGGVGQYYGSGNSAASATTAGAGLSGSGRGRFARAVARANMRSPLGVSTDGSNAWASGRNGRQRPRDWSAGPGVKGSSPKPLTGLRQSTDTALVNGSGIGQHNDQGIISAAIASAAERGPRTPPKGQENVSLLQQQATKKVTPTKTQFTFTSGANVTWPGGNSTANAFSSSGASATRPGASASHPHLTCDMATQGTQTSPNMQQTDRPGQASNMYQPASNARQQQQRSASGTQQAGQQPKKTRLHRPGKEYALAARRRRLQQEYANYHHPPSRDEIWICEFCEYESIFGSPPEALMRQYEIKDRRERRRLAEKRRLLEKAKLKGRKGKKGKAAKNAAASAQASQQQQQTPATDQNQMQSQGTQSDEFLEDEYEEDAVFTAVPHAPVKALNVATKPAVTHPPAATGKTGASGAGKGAGGGTGGGTGGGGRAA